MSSLRACMLLSSIVAQRSSNQPSQFQVSIDQLLLGLAEKSLVLLLGLDEGLLEEVRVWNSF
jgi:hypothetical protein